MQKKNFEDKQFENKQIEKQNSQESLNQAEIRNNIMVAVWGRVIRYIGVAAKILLFLLAVLLPFLSMLLHEAANWMLKTWANLSMEELVAQLKTPIKGTNQDVIWDFIETCVPPAVIAILFAGLLIFVVRKTQITKYVVNIGVIASSVILILTSANLVWNELDVGEYLENQDTFSVFFEENYVDPNYTTITFPEQKRNLVYIFMESMESTYASKEIGGGFDENYIPEMSALAAENINFSNNGNLGGLLTTDGATWTMGALVAETAGVPLKVNLRAENVDEDISVLPGITNLGDILEQQGYQQVIMFGSEGVFAGRQQYFEEHGNYQVKDYIYAKENGWIPEDYRAWWGYEDMKLYDFARQQLTELAATGQPFNLTLLTVDSHFEDGYICSLCQNQYADNQYANVMSCASRQIAGFVNWIKEQPFYENTTIVIVGDHLTMDSDFCNPVSEDYQRSVYDVIINAPVYPVNQKNRQATTLDMFPTTIAALGGQIEGDRLGLGTNLFSDQLTLAEQYGIDTVNAEIRKRSIFYENVAGKENVDDSVMY